MYLNNEYMDNEKKILNLKKKPLRKSHINIHIPQYHNLVVPI